ncbi:hypothetical protein [Rubrobacter aplysinae]|uniref:hypothetical protein n=1 Tax=Rubrobacter aplysinae TaxID=909625 RepID=UPI00064BF6D1|nr:hypothetical protein [Rubrobacter aplysinae]
MSEAQISTQDLDSTLTNLGNGVRELVLDRAIAEVSGWQRKLEASGEEDLVDISRDLLQLREELDKGVGDGGLDTGAVGELLNKLGSKVQAVADKRGTSAGPGVEEKLKALGGLLSNEAASISS